MAISFFTLVASVVFVVNAKSVATFAADMAGSTRLSLGREATAAYMTPWALRFTCACIVAFLIMQIIPVAIGQQLNASGVKDVAWILYPIAAVALATGCTLLIRSTTSARRRLAWALIVAGLVIVTIAVLVMINALRPLA